MRSAAPPTLEAAIGKLGLDELKRLAFALAVGATAAAPGPLAELRRDQWRRSLLAALFCEDLAPRRGIDPGLAYLAGLLHDFGAVVVIAGLEARGHLPVLPATVWRSIVEDLHIEVGMMIVARWQLPVSLFKVVEHHHAPSRYTGLDKPVVELVAIVDQIIAILDRGPTVGIEALLEISELSFDERDRVGSIVAKVAGQMARFEGSADLEASSAIDDPGGLEGGWPVDFVIEGNRSAFRACALSTNAVAFRSGVPLQPAWLTELTLCCEPEPIRMLANVKRCDLVADGEYLIVVQPFGLSGAEAVAWLGLLARTRPKTA